MERSDGTVVAEHVEAAESIGSRFMGLMFRADLPEGHGLVLRPCSSIHMFFMRFPLDAVFVDKEGRVVRIYASLKPWRMTLTVRKAKACIELPAGTMAKAGVTEGATIVLTDVSSGG
jgi:uncharacterized membrane protein (UPF0127 family)